MTMLCALEEGDEITERRLLELLGLAAEELQEELRTLREAGCVTTAEGTRGRIRGTWIGTTRSGRADFRTYVRTLEAHLVAGDGP